MPLFAAQEAAFAADISVDGYYLVTFIVCIYTSTRMNNTSGEIMKCETEF